MVEAFDDLSILCIGMMYPDDAVPLADAGFEIHLVITFMKSAYFFSDVKTAVSKAQINQATLKVESHQAYHSDFCKTLIPVSDEIVLQISSPDVTLIKAFYDGIPRSVARETSRDCSLHLQYYPDCLTKTIINW